MRKIRNYFQKNKTYLFLKKTVDLITHSLKYNLIFSFFFVVLLPIIISSNFEKTSKKNFISFNDETIANINYKFDYIENTSLSLLVNSNIIDILNSTTETNLDKILLQSKFEQELKPFLLFNPTWNDTTLKSIFLFKDFENYYYVTKDSSHLNSINEHLNMIKNIDNTNNLPLLIPSKDKSNTIYFIRKCFDLKTAECKGYLSMEIDSSLIFDFLKLEENYPSLEYLAINTKTEKIIASSKNSILDKKIILKDYLDPGKKINLLKFNKKKYFSSTNDLFNSNINLITLVPINDLFSNANSDSYKYILLLIFISISCIKIYSVLYQNISNPLSTLSENIQKVKNGQLDTKMPNYKFEELNDISEVFNTMTDEINNLINQVYDKQLLITESELKFLKSQMDPHFIFNVLDTINWHAKLSNNNTISELTTNLSKLLRANINFSGNEFISLKEELEYINFYIKLQKSRFGDRLNVDISIADNDLLAYTVPKLCIQPLIENAIVHGLEPKTEGGRLKLQIWEDSNDLYFLIIDDGVGFDSDKLLKSNNNPVDLRKKKHNSVALHNISRRLELLYGENYSINIKSKIGEGSKIMLNIPLCKENENV